MSLNPISSQSLTVLFAESSSSSLCLLGEGIRAIASRSRGGCYGTSSLRGAVGGVATGRATTQESRHLVHEGGVASADGRGCLRCWAADEP